MSQVARAASRAIHARSEFAEAVHGGSRESHQRDHARANRRLGRAIVAAELDEHEAGDYVPLSSEDQENDWCSACGGPCSGLGPVVGVA